LTLSKGTLKTRSSSLAEERVNLAISITDACVHVCADAVRDRYKIVKEEDLLERIRARIMYQRRRKREV